MKSKTNREIDTIGMDTTVTFWTKKLYLLALAKLKVSKKISLLTYLQETLMSETQTPLGMNLSN